MCYLSANLFANFFHFTEVLLSPSTFSYPLPLYGFLVENCWLCFLHFFFNYYIFFHSTFLFIFLFLAKKFHSDLENNVSWPTKLSCMFAYKHRGLVFYWGCSVASFILIYKWFALFINGQTSISTTHFNWSTSTIHLSHFHFYLFIN